MHSFRTLTQIQKLYKVPLIFTCRYLLLHAEQWIKNSLLLRALRDFFLFISTALKLVMTVNRGMAWKGEKQYRQSDLML